MYLSRKCLKYVQCIPAHLAVQTHKDIAAWLNTGTEVPLDDLVGTFMTLVCSLNIFKNFWLYWWIFSVPKRLRVQNSQKKKKKLVDIWH